MYKWIDHIVVRVKDLEEGLKDYEGKWALSSNCLIESNNCTLHHTVVVIDHLLEPSS